MVSFYLASQNQTHKYEFDNQLLWSPKLTRGGRRNQAYENMAHVQKGDIIFHVFNKTIHAVSIAQDDAYTSPKPKEYNNEIWQDDGWRVDCKMFECNLSIETFKQHNSNVFDKNGDLKQQYLFLLDGMDEKFLIDLLDEFIAKSVVKSMITTNEDDTEKVPDLKEGSDPVSRGTITKHPKSNKDRTNRGSKDSVNKEKIGKRGEKAALKYLNKKYAGTNTTIKPVSKNLLGDEGDDTKGYDIILENQKQITYIDVKTTSGSNGQFYMSSNETNIFNKVLQSKNEMYEIFRIYKMSEHGTGDPEFYIYDEDRLKQAYFMPVEYSVNIV